MSGYRGGRRYYSDGGGRGYGKGGRHGNYGNQNRDRNYDERRHDQESGNDGKKHRGQGHRPHGLRGREIGMFYAKRSRGKNLQAELAQRPLVSLGKQTEAHIEKLLHNINAADNVPAQPTRSYAPVENMKDLEDDRPGSSSNQSSRCGSEWEMQLGQGSKKLDDQVAMSSDKGQEENGDNNGDVPNLDEMMKMNEEEMAYIFKDEMTDEYFRFKHKKDPAKDLYLREEFYRKQDDPYYQKMMQFRKNLPSFNMVEEILSAINSHQVTVISGETGCGKTTQVPQFILDDYITRGEGYNCRIMCTQPRRISAVSVAERVADERAEDCGKGNSVGYTIRLERKMPRSSGSILFCTTGIMLKYLEHDPLLQSCTHVIIDEIHERDLLSDFMMIILKDILPERPDLKVILMSATLNAEQFSKYYNNCPMLHIPGFTYPVKEYLLEDVLEITKYSPPSSEKMPKRPYRGRKRHEIEEEKWKLEAWSRSLQGKYSDNTIQTLQNMDMEKIDLDLMACLIRHICFNMEDGAILVFVPGWSEISELNKILLADSMFNSNKFLILPLHSLMPTVNQKEVFDKPPQGVRKIIIATNIAETSITINDVVHVIDGGKIKVKDYDPELNLATLDSKWVSKANAKQRRGRAGRVQPGKCFHFYTSLHQLEFSDYLRPEILRTRLEELCLQIKILNLGKIEPFVSKAMDRPSQEALNKAIVTLQDMRALDHDENLLPLGYHLARMPVDPQSGKMILFGAMFGCLDPICTVAASLSFKDAFTTPLGKEKEAYEAKKELAEEDRSDHIVLIRAFDGWERAVKRRTERQYCWKYFLSGFTLKLLRDMKKQLVELLYDLRFVSSKDVKDPRVNINSNNTQLIKAILCAGLYPNVAKVQKIRKHYEQTPKLRLKDEMIKHSYIHPGSVNSREKQFDTQWMVFHKLMKTTSVYAFDTTMVSPYPLLFFGGDITTGVEASHPEYHGGLVIVDDWIKFWASSKTATLVHELRKEMDKILENKITKPGMTNWDPKSKEGAVMRAIIDLITTEDIQHKQGVNDHYMEVDEFR